MSSNEPKELEGERAVLKKHTKLALVRWEPIHEQIVHMSARGLSNKAIAASLGYNEVYISRVLNTNEAIQIKAQIVAEARKNLIKSMDMGLEIAQESAIENIKSVLGNKELLKESPFQMLRASMDFARGMGKLADTNSKPTQQNNFFGTLDPKLQKELAEGIARANRVMTSVEVSGTVVDDSKKSA